MFHAALIDLDGTLVDSAPELAESIDRMLAGMGFPPAGEAATRSRVGGGVGALIEQTLYATFGRPPDDAERARARALFDAAYIDRAGRHAPVYPGVFDGLAVLRIAGLRLACVTNKAGRFTGPMLSRLGFAGYMDTVVAGDDAAALKPDAAPLLLAAERLGAAIGRCVMIGDSAIDIAAARAAGCPVWCVRSDYGGGEPVETAGPDAVFDRFDELADALVTAGRQSGT